MDRRVNRLKARSIANKLLSECKIVQPPVKLKIVAEKLSLFVVKGDINKLDLFKKKNLSAVVDIEEKIVIYNPTHPTVRKRFSVAHEIGHLVLGHTFGGDIFNLESKNPLEIEANMFAAELLMPFNWVKKDLSSGLNIPDLAQKYWVSIEAAGWRLYNSDALLLR